MKKIKRRTITKKEITDAIALRMRLKQIEAKKIIQDLLDTMIEELAKGNKIELRDFGIFKIHEKNGRVARNPKTKKKVKVPPKRIVKFKAGKRMGEMVEELDI